MKTVINIINMTNISIKNDISNTFSSYPINNKKISEGGKNKIRSIEKYVNYSQKRC